MSHEDLERRLQAAYRARTSLVTVEALRPAADPTDSPTNLDNSLSRGPRMRPWLLPVLVAACVALVLGATAILTHQATRSAPPAVGPTVPRTASSAPPTASSSVTSTTHPAATSVSSRPINSHAIPPPATPTSTTVKPVACPTAAGMLTIVTTLIGGGPYEIAPLTPASAYGCQSGWAFILFRDLVKPSNAPNNIQSRDLRYAGGHWRIASKQTACGTNLSGPMPSALKQAGGCGG